MSTYNGEKYLSEQIDSLLKQEGVELQILVRDDGSNDKTHEMLDKYQDEGILKWYTGANLRSAKSFMDLIMNAPDSDYYAFCDQDDVWKEDKLKRAVEKLEEMVIEKDIPLLYCSDYQLVDEKLKNLPDNGHHSTDTFPAALVSSCCTGCTVVFNKKLRDFLVKKLPEHLVMHDDWVHKVCLALNGKVYYDEYKGLFYRQHGNNVDGGVHGFRSKVGKILERIKSGDNIRSEQLKDLLSIYKEEMDEENNNLLTRVAYYKDKSIIYRIKLAFSKTITTPFERLNKGFRMAIVFKYF